MYIPASKVYTLPSQAPGPQEPIFLDDEVEEFSLLRVDRLLECYDPWEALGIKRPATLAELGEARSGYQHDPGWGRCDTYHYPRIRTLMDDLNSGPAFAPISLDNYCSNGQVFPEVVLCDGHHRLCAADLAGSASILATYSGRLDLLDYLTGKRFTRP